jgi:hypothetical protein
MTSRLLNDKRGDVTITMLVIGVFALCSLTLISFYYSSFIVRDPSTGIELMEKMNSNIEKYSSGMVLDKFEDSPADILIEDKDFGDYLFLKKTDDDVVLFYVKYYLN